MEMMLPKVLIVDDEEKARDSVKAVIRLAGINIRVVGEADGIDNALEIISNHSPDIILLDVNLGNGTGFDLLRKIGPPRPFVIFITAYEEHALQAFRFSAIDYLLKPVDPTELRNAIEKAVRKPLHFMMEEQLQHLIMNLSGAPKETKKIVLKTTEQIHIVGVKDIVRLESDKNYTTFFMNSNARILVSKTLKEYDDMLSPFGFIRVHQSHLVNIDYIDKFDKRDGGYLVLKDKALVPVSTRKKEELIRLLDQL